MRAALGERRLGCIVDFSGIHCYNKETYPLSSAWRLVTKYNKKRHPLSSALAAADKVK